MRLFLGPIGDIFKAINKFGTGKATTYLSVDRCSKLLKIEGKSLVLSKSFRDFGDEENKKTFDWIFGDDETIKKYTESLSRISAEIEPYL